MRKGLGITSFPTVRLPIHRPLGKSSASSRDRSQVTACRACGKVITKYASDLTISLSISVNASSQETVTLEELYNRHFGEEALDDVCPCCEATGRRTKDTKLILGGRLPFVMAFHLKRWEWATATETWVKKTHKVSYETLFHEGQYALRGVVVHHGNERGRGHYTAYVCAADNFWYLCDDDAAPQLVRSVDTVLQQQAYMLFYERF